MLIRIIAEGRVWRESSWSEAQGRGFRFVSRSVVCETLWCSQNSAIQGVGQSGSGRFEDFLNCGRERRRASRQRKGEEEAIKI